MEKGLRVKDKTAAEIIFILFTQLSMLLPEQKILNHRAEISNSCY